MNSVLLRARSLEERSNSIGQLDAVVGEHVVTRALSPDELLELSPRFAAGSTSFGFMPRALFPVVCLVEMNSCLIDFSDVVFAVACFDLNDPMRGRKSADADVPRHDFHCTAVQGCVPNYDAR